MRPNDSSARPVGVDEARADDRGVRDASELAASADRSRRRGTTVSLLSSSRFAPVLARMPTLFARGEAEVRAGLDHADGRPAPRGVGAAVGRRVVDDDDLVAIAGGGSAASDARQRSRSAARVVAHDDDREVGHCQVTSHGPSLRVRAASGVALAARAPPAAS